MPSKYTDKQLKLMEFLYSTNVKDHQRNGLRFSKIIDLFNSSNLRLSANGLNKMLKKLMASKDIEKFINVDNKSSYRMTVKGENNFVSFYWPIVDKIGSLQREKSQYFMMSHYGDDYHLISEDENSMATSHCSYYLLPLSLELHNAMLENMAIKLVSGEISNVLEFGDTKESNQASSVILSIEYHLDKLDRLSSTFLSLLEHDEANEEALFDIISNLLGHQSLPIKRDLVSAISFMLMSTYMWATQGEVDQQLVKKILNLDRKLGELLFNRMDLLSDLDMDVVDVFIEDIEAGKDPLKNPSLDSTKIIGDHPVKGFKSYWLQEYITASIIKKHDLSFRSKAEEYLKGTQGLILRSIQFQFKGHFS